MWERVEMFAITGSTGSTGFKGMDLTLIKELEETRKAVHEARMIFREVREKEGNAIYHLPGILFQEMFASKKSDVKLQIILPI